MNPATDHGAPPDPRRQGPRRRRRAQVAALESLPDTMWQGRRRRRRAQVAALESLPDTIELIVLGVRAGRSTSAAVVAAVAHAAPPMRPVLGEVARRLERGQPLADALTAFSDLLGPPAVAFVDELATAERYGEPIGPVLDRLAADARAERHRLAERRARRLPVTLAFPLVVCTLPGFVLVAVAPAVLAAVAALRDRAP